MSDGHTHLEQLILNLLLWILEIVSKQTILLLELFSFGKFRHFIVDLSQLLHFQVVLAYKVLLLLRKIPQVLCRSACKDLATRHSLATTELGTGSKDAEALDGRTLANGGTHAHVGEALEIGGAIDVGVGADVDVVANAYLIRLSRRIATNSRIILDYAILADFDWACVASKLSPMPSR